MITPDSKPEFMSTNPDDYHALAASTAIGGISFAIMSGVAESRRVKDAAAATSIVLLITSFVLGRTASEVADIYGYPEDRMI